MRIQCIISNMSAYRIPCKISQLRLDKTLVCGQSFRWRESIPGVWIGVLHDRVWKIWQTDTDLYFQVFPSWCHTQEVETLIKTEVPSNSSLELARIKDQTQQTTDFTESEKQTKSKRTKLSKLSKNVLKAEKCENIVHVKQEVQEVPVKGLKESIAVGTSEKKDGPESLLRDYFQLDVKLGDLYKHWSKVDSNFEKVSSNFEGVRILRQNPVENLFSFIISSANNISRISSLVEKLCENYGKFVTEVDGKQYFAFPPVSALTGESVENELRNMGFGYRAKYINMTAKMVENEHGVEWLYGLRKKSFEEARSELMKLSGVGAKVADCICLMSLDKPEAVPVDTHVWQIAARHYMPKLQKTKSLTEKLYKEIGVHFRELWGPYAGWAHSVLFTADLKKFKELSPEKPKLIRDVSRMVPSRSKMGPSFDKLLSQMCCTE